MNTERNNEADSRIGALYREGDDLRAPDALNRAVLDDARRAVDTPRVVMPSWLRPLAFAATLALGVGLLFEMQAVTPLQETGSVRSDGTPPAVPAARDRALPAATAVGKETASEESSGNRRMQKYRDAGAEPAAIMDAEAPGAPLPAAATGDVQALQAPVASQDRQIILNAADAERRESLSEPQAGQPLETPAALQREFLYDAARQAAKPEAKSALRSSSERSADRDSMAPDTRHCAEARDTAEWWQCIVRLREAGETEGADAELTLLLSLHPDFTAPE